MAPKRIGTTRRSRKRCLLHHAPARAVANLTGSTAIDLLGEAVVAATTTRIGIITERGAIGSGARVQTVLEIRRLVLLIAGVGVIQTDTERGRGVTEVVLLVQESTTAIQIERRNLVKILPKRNVDARRTRRGKTGTEFGLPMPLTQNKKKEEPRRTLTFYRNILLSATFTFCTYGYPLSCSFFSLGSSEFGSNALLLVSQNHDSHDGEDPD